MTGQEQDNKSLVAHYDNDVISRYLIEKVTALSALPYKEKMEAVFKYDQFHIGGVQATRKLLDLVALKPSSRVLDIGSGFGGVARYLAYFGGCAVTALDLVPSYVALAQELDGLLQFEGKVDYLCGDAVTGLPDIDGFFDAAVLVHVGMNIENKAALFQSIHQKLKPAGRILIYDLLLGDQETKTDKIYPLPWASSKAEDHSATHENYMKNLERTGFKVTHEEVAREFSYKITSNPLPDEVMPLIGPDFKQALANLRQFLMQERGAPWFIVAEKM